MNWLTKRILLLATIAMTVITNAYADWPFVRGDATASGAIDSDLPEDLDVVWEFTADNDGFEATAVIQNGIVYVGDVESTFYAIQLADGKLVWKKSFEESGFLTAAAVVGEHIYVNDFYGVVRCLSIESGEQLWKYETDTEVYAAPNYYAAQVLVVTESGELISLDAKSGKENWKFQIEAPLRCWPTVVDGRIFLAGCDERLHAIDSKTGKEADGLDIDGPTGVTPAMLDKHMYFGTESGTLYSVDTERMQTEWTHNTPNQGQPIRAASAVNKSLVIYCQGKQIMGLNPSSGDPLWDFSVRSKAESAPVITGERVYFGTIRGRLYGLGALSGEEEWQYEAGGKFKAAAAISKDRLVIGNTDGTLYCFGKKKRKATDAH